MIILFILTILFFIFGFGKHGFIKEIRRKQEKKYYDSLSKKEQKKYRQEKFYDLIDSAIWFIGDEIRNR